MRKVDGEVWAVLGGLEAAQGRWRGWGGEDQPASRADNKTNACEGDVNTGANPGCPRSAGACLGCLVGCEVVTSDSLAAGLCLPCRTLNRLDTAGRMPGCRKMISGGVQWTICACAEGRKSSGVTTRSPVCCVRHPGHGPPRPTPTKASVLHCGLPFA